jgi:hypothetical protein
MIGWLGGKIAGYALGFFAVVGLVLGFIAKFRREGEERAEARMREEELRRINSRKRTDAEVAKVPDDGLDAELNIDGWLRKD